MINKFNKGDRFTTPSGVIKIKSKSRNNKKTGEGYRIGSVVIPFDEFERNVNSGLWIKI